MFRFNHFLCSLCCGLVPAMGLAQGARNQSQASIILTTEGEACLGQEHSREQTVKLAQAQAKRIAAEYAKSHVSSETTVEDGMLLQDLIAAYAKASVRVIEELEKKWFETAPDSGYADQCYRVKLKMEVIPAPMEPMADGKPQPSMISSPRAPLNLELWTDRDVYRVGDTMTFFFRGNKPFYAHAVYRDAEGNLIEVTPRSDSRQFQGGAVYQIPSEADSFTLKITPPLGEEQLILYGSTQPMGDYSGQKRGDMTLLNPMQTSLDHQTRGLAIIPKSNSASNPPKAEFAEVKADVRVEKK